MKRYIVTGMILLLIMFGVVILHPSKPQYESSNNTEDSYEYYYNENVEDEEDSLLPEDLNSILADNPTVPLDLIPSSITVLVNRLYPLPSNYIPSSLVVPNVKFNFHTYPTKEKCAK